LKAWVSQGLRKFFRGLFYVSEASERLIQLALKYNLSWLMLLLLVGVVPLHICLKAPVRVIAFILGDIKRFRDWYGGEWWLSTHQWREARWRPSDKLLQQQMAAHLERQGVLIFYKDSRVHTSIERVIVQRKDRD